MVSVDSWWDALGRDRFEAVLELVLCAMTDDYESVETILTTVNEWGTDRDSRSWAARTAAPLSRKEVIKALRELTRQGYAQPYNLGAREPCAMPIEFREDEVDGLWFYATPKGIQAIRQFVRSE